jgi:Kdo2-lipid IVA lauroyltransferase/acyltransferase
MTPVPDTDGSHRPSLANRIVLAVMRLLAGLPLSWVRAAGWLFGRSLHLVAARRRRIALTNWMLCFPGSSPAQAQRAIRDHFVHFAQAWLDRSWLWEGRPELVRRRLKLVGDLDALKGDAPTVLFAPHFVGMDTGWTALTAHLDRKFCGIYARQLNVDIDRWMSQGRQRFGEPHIVAKSAGLKALVSALRAGEPLYLLPDMDYGRRDSIFVPFFGVQAATVPSLSRFARMARAQVVPVVARMTREGYEVTVHPPWTGFPTDDVAADTARMNRELEAFIRQMPEQYYWVHKRFKTRPEGQTSPYGRD